MNTKLLDASAPREVVLVRLVVGCVFLSEGIQKFLYPDALGVGRFAKIGIPAPQVLAPFVGVVEIVCGGLVLRSWREAGSLAPGPVGWQLGAHGRAAGERGASGDRAARSPVSLP